MAISRAALIPRVRAILEDRPSVDFATASNGADTTIVVAKPTIWTAGDYMENQADGECALVTDAVGTSPVTVVRDYFGEVTEGAMTTQLVFKNPKYRYHQIDQALVAAISKLWPDVWKLGSDTVTPDPTTQWYDLNATMRDVVKVSQVLDGDEVIYGPRANGGTRPIEVRRNMDSTLAASGVGIRFPQGLDSDTEDVTIVHRSVITGTSDIEDDGNLPVAECVIYGALARLLVGKEIPLITQGSDKEANKSVRSGARLSASAYYDRLFRQSKEELRMSLIALGSNRLVEA